MPTLSNDLYVNAVFPALVAGVLFYFVGGRGEPFRTRVQSAILAFAFAVGGFLMLGKIYFPPQNVSEGFVWSAVALVLFVWMGPKPSGSRYAIRAIFVLALGLLTLWPIHQSLHGPTDPRNLLAFFFLGLGTWSIVERASSRVQPLALLILPLVSVVALTMLLLLKDGTAIARFSILIAALIAAVAVVAIFAPRRISLAAVLPMISVFVILMMASGHFYLHINPWHMIYICVPFLLLWIRGWLSFIPRQPVVEALVLFTLAAIPIVYFFANIKTSVGPLL